jgi:putative transcription factor
MNCEMCGQDTTVLKKVVIEYSVLNVCPSCARFGRPVPQSQSRAKETPPPTPSPAKPIPKPAARKERDVLSSHGGRELAMDYSERVKKARMSKGWTPEDLGKKINEKKSLITKLEAGEIKPNEKLRKKLERALGIKLTEELEDVRVAKKKSSPTTLGDIVKMK